MENHDLIADPDLETILAVDARARVEAEAISAGVTV